MAGYFGTQRQQQLQALAEAHAAFIATTPGACQAGRFMSCDDPDRLGWDRITEFLDRDGICGFRLIPVAEVDELGAHLLERGWRFDTWDVYLAGRAEALAASAAGEQRAGRLGPAATVALGDRDGNVVATAHGYLPHNVHSPYHRHAWGGLVAVAPSQRGRGLGNYVNARMVVRVFHHLGATHIYELVAAANVPSRRMVEACGLRHEPGLVCGVAMPNDGARFTR